MRDVQRRHDGDALVADDLAGVARLVEKLAAAKSRIEALLTQIPETET